MTVRGQHRPGVATHGVPHSAAKGATARGANGVACTDEVPAGTDAATAGTCAPHTAAAASAARHATTSPTVAAPCSTATASTVPCNVTMRLDGSEAVPEPEIAGPEVNSCT